MRRAGQGSPGASDADDGYSFSDLVSVQVKTKGRDEFVASLTVRLKTDCAAHPRSLLVEFTDEADLLFYYSLVLSEGDFHTLKSEQRLLIDFQSFPVRLAELLQRCSESSGAAAESAAASGGERMVARLDCGGGEGLFSIVECNQFRELTHIALRLRHGTDEAVKQHLAEKLRSSRSEASDLRERLQTGEDNLAQARRQVDELGARSRVVAEERTHLERSLEATRERELSDLRQEHAKAVAELQRVAAEDRAKLEAGLSRSLDEALARAARAEREGEELRQRRQALTTSEQSLQEKLRAAEAQLRDSQREAQGAREKQQQLELLKFQHEREIGELRIQLAGAKEQAASREQLLANQSSQIEQAGSQRGSLEDALAVCKQQVQALEEKFALSANEIAKGNQIIQSLHTTAKQAKARLKMKAAEVAQKEKAVLELERAEEMGKRVLEEKAHELARAREREGRLQEDAGGLKKRLAEAHEVLRSNQEVIEFLNRQLTERDLRSLPVASLPAASPEPPSGAISDILKRTLPLVATPPGAGGLAAPAGSPMADALKWAGAGSWSLKGSASPAPVGGLSTPTVPGVGGDPLGPRAGLGASPLLEPSATGGSSLGAAISTTGLELTASSERGLLYGGGSSLSAGSPWGVENRNALLGPVAYAPPAARPRSPPA